MEIAGVDMEFQRTGADTIRVSHRVPFAGNVSMDGKFVAKDDQIDFALGAPKRDGALKFATVRSLPTAISVFRQRSGRMVYRTNKPVDIPALPAGKQAAGSYYFGH